MKNLLLTEFGNAGTQVLATLRIIRQCKGEGSGQQYKPPTLAVGMPIFGKLTQSPSLTVRACVWNADSRVVGYRYALVLDLDKSHQPVKLDILTIDHELPIVLLFGSVT